jgi:hypothetical protein
MMSTPWLNQTLIALVLSASAAALPSQAFADENTGTVTQGSGPEVPKLGVIAADERGSFGYAIGYSLSDPGRARRDAINGCGQPGCKIVMEGPSICIALTDARRSDGAYWYWVASGPRRWEAGQPDPGEKTVKWCEQVPEAAAVGCKLQIYVCQ